MVRNVFCIISFIQHVFIEHLSCASIIPDARYTPEKKPDRSLSSQNLGFSRGDRLINIINKCMTVYKVINAVRKEHVTVRIQMVVGG